MFHPRPDISPHLVHYTKGTDEEAFAVLRLLIRESRILGNVNMIKGEHRCVCFSEAPPNVSRAGLNNMAGYRRYAPFGIMFNKSKIFEWGGRPVIYQADEEYGQLRPTNDWRHVRYEPARQNPVDFTWEREWRMKCTELQFTPADAIVVVPNQLYAERLRAAHDVVQDWQVLQYSLILDEDIAEQYREDFPWRVSVLDT